jgi:hypothetical protein
MRTIQKCPVAQGDMLVIPGGTIPANAVEVPRENGAVIVTHSESGHHHSIHDANVSMWAVPGDQFTAWIKVKAPHADIVHHRAWDTHETLRLLNDESKGTTVYEIKRQREPIPEGWARAQD